MNQIDIIEYEEGIKQLVKYAIRKELIPVFGAGFTAGCQSINGIVPNGKRATESMCDMILNSGSCPLQKCDITEMDFSEISDLFFEYVSRDERATYFEDFYTGVVLFQHQIDFLTKINWPYAYTLNIDDGIEKTRILILYYLIINFGVQRHLKEYCINYMVMQNMKANI